MTENDDAFDRQLQTALNDVAVPQDLAQRLRSGLRQHAGVIDPVVVAPKKSAEVSFAEHSERAGKKSVWVRRSWIGFAIAVGLSFIIVTFLRPSTPLTRHDCVSHCIGLLEEQLAGTPEWNVEDPAIETAGVALEQLQVQQLSLVGGISVEQKPKMGQSLIWSLRLAGSNKDVYLVQLPTSLEFDGLTEFMEEVESSGKWSAAAMKLGDRIFVVLSEEPVNGLIRRPAWT